jgi:hypothetical protein
MMWGVTYNVVFSLRLLKKKRTSKWTMLGRKCQSLKKWSWISRRCTPPIRDRSSIGTEIRETEKAEKTEPQSLLGTRDGPDRKCVIS